MSFPFQTIENGDGSVTIKDVPIFNTHQDRGFKCNEDWMQRAVADSERRYRANGWRPKITIGHNEKDKPEKPVVGFMEKLRYWSGKLFANLVVPVKFFKESLSQGQFPDRSAEVFPPRHYIPALALLGGTTPHFNLKQMTPYAQYVKDAISIFGSAVTDPINYEDDEDPVFVVYKEEESQTNVKSETDNNKGITNYGGETMPTPEELKKLIDEGVDKKFAAVLNQEEDEEVVAPDEETMEENQSETDVSGAEGEKTIEVKKEMQEDAATGEEEKKEDEAVDMKEEFAAMKKQFKQYRVDTDKKVKVLAGNNKVLVTANNAMQNKNKTIVLAKYCEDQLKSGIPMDVEKTVGIMMKLDEQGLEDYKLEIQSRPKVPTNKINFSKGSANAEGEFVDDELERLYEENKQFYQDCGLTKQDLYTGQHGLITQGAKPQQYMGEGTAPLSTEVSVKYAYSDDEKVNT